LGNVKIINPGAIKLGNYGIMDLKYEGGDGDGDGVDREERKGRWRIASVTFHSLKT
jgi:hypothetical protein